MTNPPELKFLVLNHCAFRGTTLDTTGKATIHHGVMHVVPTDMTTKTGVMLPEGRSECPQKTLNEK
ncbi:hypothetical protein HPB48_014432 [Haemaphysalis longicornis]|uniref:Uncharacterized protein n=1 Tax=Haemaphysalis longicornis TaxID=44386 RepID=A0A9J6GTT5_HAELO|nr:hypothetical protein HPB48_014432 [Haemaphysalis longicornis]